MRRLWPAAVSVPLLITTWVACGRTELTIATGLCGPGQSTCRGSGADAAGSTPDATSGSVDGALEGDGDAADDTGGDSSMPGSDAARSGGDAALDSGEDAEPDSSEDAGVDSGVEAAGESGAGNDAGSHAWELMYNSPANGGIGTNFFRTGVGPDGVYSGDCYGPTDTATVSGTGPSYVETPMAGCFEVQGQPCIECGPGNCPSGTAVTLLPVDAGEWQGTCGSYTVTLWQH